MKKKLLLRLGLPVAVWVAGVAVYERCFRTREVIKCWDDRYVPTDTRLCSSFVHESIEDAALCESVERHVRHAISILSGYTQSETLAWKLADFEYGHEETSVVLKGPKTYSATLRVKDDGEHFNLVLSK